MSSRWRPYPAYKDSGIKWLGVIPARWDVRRLKFVADVNMGQSPSSDECNERGYGPPFLQGNAEFGERHPTAVQFCPTANKMCTSGDLLLSVRAPVGQLNVADQSYGIGRGLCAVTPNSGLDRTFAWYSLHLTRNQLDAVATGSTYDAVSLAEVKNIWCPSPTLLEQRAIAEFLDRETGKIDRLIRKQQRLIELLEEKRAALISHAVTKGLDPDVPMTDSGIPWLGAMPAHWDLAPLKHFVAQTADAIKTGPFGSHLLSSEMQGDEVKVYNQRNVIDGDLAGGDKYISEEKYRELEAFSVFPGDILVTTRGTIGQCVTVPEHAELGILHPCLMRISPAPDKLLPDYLIYLIQDSYLVQTQLFLMSNATTIEVIYSNNLRQVLVPQPPSGEQLRIVEELDSETAKLDALISRVETLIGRLQEYRTTLVSAAVTGKIDVREGVPPA